MVAKIGIDAFAVGDGCLGGVAVLEVDWPQRLARSRGLFPKHLAAVEIEADDFPVMNAGRDAKPVAAKI